VLRSHRWALAGSIICWNSQRGGEGGKGARVRCFLASLSLAFAWREKYCSLPLAGRGAGGTEGGREQQLPVAQGIRQPWILPSCSARQGVNVA